MTDIIVTENSEDFTEWNWGTEINAISERAARMVLQELIADAALEFEFHKDKATVSFSSFDYHLMIEYPIIEMMQYWIDARGDKDGKITKDPNFKHDDDDNWNETNALLRDLEICVSKLKAAIS